MRTVPPFPPHEMRALMLEVLPTETSLFGANPEPRYVYLPASHVKALHPSAMVVAGMRGAGKSFWWAALQQPNIRALVSQLEPRAGVEEQSRIAVGFGEKPDLDQYPSKDVLKDLLQREEVTPRLIWRTVVVHKLADTAAPPANLSDWKARVRWVASNPEAVDRLLAEKDAEFARTNTWFIVLFDALDRSAAEWRDIRRLIRGLLETALDFRVYSRLRVKCFLRIDQLEDSHVTDFPDASKVLASRVELTWPVTDLYGLLWQYLANAAHPWAETFRQLAGKNFRIQWATTQLQNDLVWRMSPDLVHDENTQRDLVHAITGKWMGRDHRRGFPYTWIPGHLADARGRTSPRSFLAALRAAAEDTEKCYPEHSHALHYESIKRGVQSASQIRVTELKEDYPWVDLLMEPLHGLNVPCKFDEIVSRWNEADIFNKARHQIDAMEDRQPPLALLYADPEGLRRDLEDLGVFLRTRDNRVNIPDVFRVGYGLGRRGGVKPVPKMARS